MLTYTRNSGKVGRVVIHGGSVALILVGLAVIHGGSTAVIYKSVGVILI